MAQTVKCLLTMRETQVRSLGREVLPEKEMATQSNIIAWKIPWMEEPGRLQPMGWQSMCNTLEKTEEPEIKLPTFTRS